MATGGVHEHGPTPVPGAKRAPNDDVTFGHEQTGEIAAHVLATTPQVVVAQPDELGDAGIARLLYRDALSGISVRYHRRVTGTSLPIHALDANAR